MEVIADIIKLAAIAGIGWMLAVALIKFFILED